MSIRDTNASNEKPPLTIIAILHLAWSLILNLSSYEKDSEIGKELLKNWRKFHNRIKEPDSIKDSRYLDNISCLLFGFVESIAFERYFYYEYSRTQEKIRTQTINYWNDLADMASFSKDGTILRITGFLGIGGGADLIRHNNLIPYNKLPLPDVTGTITTFLLFGFIGLVGLVILVKYLRTWKINKTVESTLGDEQKYWKDRARPNYKNNLTELLHNLYKIQEEYYPHYDDKLTPEKIDEIINSILPQEILFELPNKDKKQR
jgi:hypothetical protein